MPALLTLIKKDLLLELRSKQALVLIVGLSLLLAILAAFGVGSASVNPEVQSRLFPVFLWLIFIFSATLAISRSQEYEMEHRAIEALLLSGLSPAAIYLAKALSNFLVMLLGQLCAMGLLAVLLNIDLAAVFGPLLLLSLLVIAAYVFLATLISPLVVSARLKHMLLPLILFPLLCPLFFAALELSVGLMLEQRLFFESFWFTLLVGLDLVYLVLGVNLYGFVIRD